MPDGKNPNKEKHIPRRKTNEPRPPITKQAWKPGTMLYPVPAVMVTCASAEGKHNILTVAWTGTVCSEPPMLSISVRKERYSYEMIRETGEFVVNVPSLRLVKATDQCGVISGRNVEKFSAAGLTPGPATKVNPPIIMDCPINIECVVRQTLELGSHVMFIAEVVAVQVSEHLVTSSGRLALEKEGIAAYSHGAYYSLGKKIGHFGYSVKKKEK